MLLYLYSKGCDNVTNVKIFGDSILEGVYFDGRYHRTKDKIKLDNFKIDNYSKMGATIERKRAAICINKEA